MATFPSITPKYGASSSNMPKLQRVHINPKVYSLKFAVSETDADTIETFLDARALDQASFDFTPPGEGSASKFVCESWSKSIPYLNRATITATFREVFEP